MLLQNACGLTACAVTLSRMAAIFALAMSLAAPGPAYALVDTIVVKYRHGQLANTTGVSDSDLQVLGHLHKASVRNLGPTRDGAFRLAIDPPLSIDDARAAINKLRLNPAMLYVNVAERAPTAKVALDAGELLPVRTLMVKYRNPDIVAAALADRPPPIDKLQRAADVARTPVAALRSMFGGAYVLQLFKPMSAAMAADVARQLASDVDVEWADPDAFVRPALVPNDTCYPVNTFPSCFNAQVPTTFMFEWHLMPGATEVGGTNLPAAWDITTGSPSINIGVVDTGFLYNHPDLAGRAIGGYDFIYDFAYANDNQPAQSAGCTAGYPVVNPLAPPCVSSRDSDPSDPGDWIDAADQTANPNSVFWMCPVYPSTWHGSHVAGTIGALSNNANGIAGVNWNSKIVPLRALGKCGGYVSDVADAIAWGAGAPVAGVPANQYPARVLNVSFTASKPCGAGLQSAIDAAVARNTVVVAPAGNNNDDVSFNEPGNCNGVITVAATQRQGIKASYSSSGSLVSIAAPGGGNNYPAAPPVSNLIVSTINNGTTAPTPSGYYYEGRVGTSSAAAHVAGVASLVLSRNPSLTPAQVASILESTARPFPVVAGATCPAATSCNCTTSTCGAGLLDAGAAMSAVPASPPKGIDFNADGKDDLVWRNSATGAAASWLMNGSSVLSAAIVYAGPNYAVTHTGDLSGDGRTDFVFRSITGITAAWLMNGTNAVSSAILMTDPSWIVLRVADFDGDGKKDLLWHNTSTGQTAIWLMNGLTASTAAIVYTHPDWVVTHTGDFNGDGKSDLVWRNQSTGETAIWLMNGVTPTASAIIYPQAAWTVTHVTDLDGDGRSDLVWRSTSGPVAAWLMNGTSVLSSAFLYYGSSDWSVTHVGDFNGDGKGDLVWRNTSAATKVVLMDGVAYIGENYVIGSAFNERVTHVADVNGDGKSDLLIRNDFDGGVTVVIMNGLTNAPSVLLLVDMNWSISPPDGL